MAPYDTTAVQDIPVGTSPLSQSATGTNGLVSATISGNRQLGISSIYYSNAGVDIRFPTTVTVSYMGPGGRTTLATFQHPDSRPPRTSQTTLNTSWTTIDPDDLIFVSWGANATQPIQASSITVSATAPTATTATIEIWGYE